MNEGVKISNIAKVQAIGKDAKGRTRYMIYITTAAKILNLEKGDKVVYSIHKVGHEKVIPRHIPESKSPNSKSRKDDGQSKSSSGLPSVQSSSDEVKVTEEEHLIEIPLDDIKKFTEEEEKFKKAWKESNDFEKEELKEKGMKQFGDRFEELTNEENGNNKELEN